MAQSIVKRGTFIVFEGCDRSGKSTACKRIVDYLNEKNEKAKLMRFPDRTTEVGSAINGYLKGQKELDDHVIHLLFSANRWEKVRVNMYIVIKCKSEIFLEKLTISQYRVSNNFRSMN